MKESGFKLDGMIFLSILSLGGHLPAYEVAQKDLQFMGLLDP